MTPQEKADELFRKMYQVRSVAASDITKHFAKQSALIAVDEIINQFDVHPSVQTHFKYDKLMYWEEVKQEIEKL
jgi:hypothetical protein